MKSGWLLTLGVLCGLGITACIGKQPVDDAYYRKTRGVAWSKPSPVKPITKISGNEVVSRGRYRGSDAICKVIQGKEYCWNTPKELYSRCRSAVPNQTACHPGEKCYYASNTYGEDVPGNCHWGYFSWNDSKEWCSSKGGRLLSKSEIDILWEDFKRQDPPWGQNPCYWTSTSRGDGFYWCKGRDENGGWTRKDGYFAAGGALCIIDSE